MEVLTNLRDDSLKRMVDAVSELIATAGRIKHEEENIRRFSVQMISVKDLLVKLQSQQPGGQFARGTAVSLLRRMEEAVNTARETIEWYHSKGSFARFVFCSSVFSTLTQCSKKIADSLRLLPITQISSALDDKRKLDAIIHSLDSMVFKIEANTEAIHSRLDMYVAEKNGIRQPTIQKLVDNPRPEGNIGSSRISPLPLPIESPEGQIGDPKKETYQLLNQNLHLYSDDEIVNVSSFCFSCPLTRKIMEDPVCVSCNHSYERKATEEYFRRGGKLCLVCKKELSSTEGKLDLKPNSALQGIISEWKQDNTRIQALKNAKKKLSDASARISDSPDNVESTNATVEYLLSLMMDMPSCISEATESSCKLIPKLAVLLKKSAGVNISAVLQCLLLIARFSDKNKEIIGRGGVIKCLLNQSSMNEAAAVEILLELSKDDRVAQKIIETSTSIAILVSILGNPEPQFAENARAVLKNLSTNVKSTILMAASGYFTPFLDQFNSEGISEETLAFMAGELAQMHLTETAASSLVENEQFIIHLSVMLSSSLPTSKLASIECIKRLMSFNRSRTWILSNGHTIPSALLCLIRDTSIEQQWKQDALEILITLIELSQPSEQQTNPCLEKLYSHNSIQDLIEQIKISTGQDDRVLLLRLLLAMVQKSSTAEDCLISNQNAVSCLYSALGEYDDSNVRLHALKLIYHIATSNPDFDVPLPPHPDKEIALRSIAAILTESRIDEEISIVAGIISHLPRSDKAINAMLQSSAVLRALHLQISRSNHSNELLENALGALMRCIDQSTSEFQMQLAGNLEHAIVQILTASSPLSKQRAAMILAHLTRCTPELSTSPKTSSHFRRNSWPFQSSTKCALHDSSCSVQRVMCLVKVGAVRPLVCMIDAANPAASEAALTALLTLFDPGASETLFKSASSIVVGSKAAAPILNVLERGSLPRAKKTAFELFRKIYKHPGITREQLEKFKAILPHLLNDDEDEHRRKVTMLIQELF